MTACATGNHCIGSAARWIQLGQATAMLAGGSEATITPMGIGGFNALKALSTRNDEPQKASRPFDADRDGFVMGEGAGVLVLEELEHARGARRADLRRDAAATARPATPTTSPRPRPTAEGAARCMRMALRDAGAAPDDVDYVNAHGTSTPLNDPIETQAIKTVFGEHAAQAAGQLDQVDDRPPARRGRRRRGDRLRAGDQHGIIPRRSTSEHPDPECDLDYVPNTARRVAVRNVLSNSFGFGGAQRLGRL